MSKVTAATVTGVFSLYDREGHEAEYDAVSQKLEDDVMSAIEKRFGSITDYDAGCYYVGKSFILSIYNEMDEFIHEIAPCIRKGHIVVVVNTGPSSEFVIDNGILSEKRVVEGMLVPKYAQ